VWLGAGTARGQSQATLSELRKLHTRLTDPQMILTAQDAKRAADRLAEWKLAPESLAPEDRARLWQIEIHIALAEGDAATALKRAQTAQGEFAEDPATLHAVYLAACAAGDAQLGNDTLRKLSRSTKGPQRKVLSQRRRWIRTVGEKAPDLVIRADDGTEFPTTRRGDRVLVIDFWNTRMSPDQETVAALCGLHREYRHSLNVDLLGVNADAESQSAAAREFAQANGYVWKQRYEHVAANAPVTHQAFRAGNPPWQVVIDTFGHVRAIGAASEPAFQYALRAAIAEARGKYKVVLPRDRDGNQMKRASDEIRPEPARKNAEATGELPSNPEAQAKLRQARLFKRTGKKTDAKRLLEEIVRDYPGTQEAREAQEILDLDFP
jgi:hypothetical protein